MRALVLTGPGALRVIDSNLPSVGPGQALVQLRLAGICGSDLAAYRGTSSLVRYPRVLGHELLVDVLESPGRPDLAGKRAVVEPLLRCDVCRACRVGRYNCCANLRVMGVHADGGLRDRFPVDTRNLFPVPENMPDEVAVLAEPTSIAHHAIERSGIGTGQVAAVFGAGTIGLLLIQLLRARGCIVFVIDIDAWRLEVAEALGAVTIRGDGGDPVDVVSDATGGETADVVFEATGNPACTRLTTELAGHASRIVLVGWNREPVDVDTVTLMRKELDLLGSRNSASEFPSVLRVLSAGAVNAGTVITQRFSLGESVQALELLDDPTESALKVIIRR